MRRTFLTRQVVRYLTGARVNTVYDVGGIGGERVKEDVASNLSLVMIQTTRKGSDNCVSTL